MNFLAYDIGFLVVFVVFVIAFLYSRRKNLKREGLLFLYKADWGIKLINYVGRKYRRTLKFLSYISIFVGYMLMATIIYLFGKIVYIYVAMPGVVRAVKIPPIMPLIPYLPQAFKLDFLPPFYFTYWILILAIVAITHEFAHGIFARLNNIKVKTTGFGFFPFFLPIFLAAFVELDEKKMEKKKIFPQLSILSAGTFANVITAILFFIILGFFFMFAFTPSGVVFDAYPYSIVGASSIVMVNGFPVTNISYGEILSLIDDNGFSEIGTADKEYVISKELFESQKDNEGYYLLYEDAPAIKANLTGAITRINGVKITSVDVLAEELHKYSPGDKVTITTFSEEEKNYEIVLGEDPEESGTSYLGVGFSQQQTKGLTGAVYGLTFLFKKPHVFYIPAFEFTIFVYNFLWWLVLISISVALVNMLPVGIFDGGRFFYLTVLAITKSEKIAKRMFKLMTYLFLLFLALIMVFWVFAF